MTDEEGLLQKLRNKAGETRPSFSGRQLAQDSWDVLNDVLEAIAEAIRSLWNGVPK